MMKGKSKAIREERPKNLSDDGVVTYVFVHIFGRICFCCDEKGLSRRELQFVSDQKKQPPSGEPRYHYYFSFVYKIRIKASCWAVF